MSSFDTFIYDQSFNILEFDKYEKTNELYPTRSKFNYRKW